MSETGYLFVYDPGMALDSVDCKAVLQMNYRKFSQSAGELDGMGPEELKTAYASLFSSSYFILGETDVLEFGRNGTMFQCTISRAVEYANSRRKQKINDVYSETPEGKLTCLREFFEIGAERIRPATAEEAAMARIAL